MIEDTAGSYSAVVEQVLAGGGEMGALMRSMDWIRTDLGPIESWPQSLWTAASICLASPLPALIWWGPHLVELYNDASRALLGTRHPAALGRPGYDGWPEIWPTVRPALESVLNQGEAARLEDQIFPLHHHDYVEECYFTFSYAPIRDENGSVGGVFATVTETTGQVLAARRLQVLRELKTGAEKSTTVQEACRVSMEIMATDPADIPFALLYLLNENGREAHLVSTAGVEPEQPVSPRRIVLQDKPDHEASWPLARIREPNQSLVVKDLITRFSQLPPGPWPEPPSAALILALVAPGQKQLVGFLVTGISSRRIFDEDYYSFLELTAERITTAICSSLVYEAKERSASADAQKRAEADVHESEARFRRLLATTSFGLIIGDIAGNISYANPASLHLLGYSEVDVIAGRLHWSQITPPEFAGRDARARLELKRYGVCAPYEQAFVTRSGRKVPVLVGASALETKPGGEPVIATFITDLSPLKAVEWALQQSEERFRIAQELSLDGFTILRAVRNVDGQIIDFTWEYANPAAEQMLGHPASTLNGKRLLEVLPGNEASRELFDRCVHVVETGQPHDVEIYYDAETINGWFRNMTVKLGDGVAISFSDITGRKQTEKALKASLREKEVLLREIHHRVKNNLQAISNLLYMQFSYATDEHVRNKLRETQNQIKSIALIHEKLYLAEDLARIDFAEYVQSLTTSLLHSYRVEPEKIRLTLQIDKLPVNVDTAIPVAIIINELVSNALKHAFPGSDKAEGEIRIELQAVADRRWRLLVSDNGIGLPERMELPEHRSLGLQLVYLLTSHMQGTVELKRDNGTTFEIIFTPLASTLTEPELAIST